MNAPLRRVAISVLVLFTLLILNANYIQVVRSDELRNDRGNTRVLAEEYNRQRGSIVVGGTEIARSVPTDDTLNYLREYPEPGLWAGVTGYYSVIYGDTQMEDAENDVLAGTDPRLTFRRLTDLFTGRDPQGGDVVLTLDPAVQKAAMSGLDGVTGSPWPARRPTTRTSSPATTRRRSARTPRTSRAATATRGSTGRSATTSRPVRCSR
jgi:peptidoglycan glycosyltransferase